MDAVTYQFYVDDYHGGSVSLDDWDAVEREARATLARYQRIYTVVVPEPGADQMAVCAIAESLAHSAAVDNIQEAGPVASASIGSVSVSYASPSASEREELARNRNNEAYRAASLYLDIYRGRC